MIRRLGVLLALLGIAWLVARMIRDVRPRRRSASDPLERDAPMVRDRVCNTFLPRAQAVVARFGADEHFFCSESCRQKFLEGTARQDQGDGPRV